MEENKKNFGYVLIGADLSVTLKEKETMTFKDGELAEAIESEYIQVVMIKGGMCLVIDEEGKLNRLPYNLIATALWGVNHDYIVGSAALKRAKIMRNLNSQDKNFTRGAGVDMSVRTQKSIQRRCKKTVLRMLNEEQMRNELYDMMERCDDVTYYYPNDDEDTLMGSLVGAEEECEASELRTQFAILSGDCYNMLEDMNDSWNFPKHFDGIMTFTGHRHDDVFGWEPEEGDYCGMEWNDWDQDELAKSLKNLTKSEILMEFRQSFQIALSFLSLKYRYDDLVGCADVLTSEFADRCKTAKRINELYEEVTDWRSHGAQKRKAYDEFNKVLQQMPQEEWLK